MSQVNHMRVRSGGRDKAEPESMHPHLADWLARLALLANNLAFIDLEPAAC